MRRSSRPWISLLLGAAGLLLAAGVLAPYLYAEVQFDLHGQVPVVLPKSSAPVAGQWFDEYFVVQALDPTTFAIGEPRYYQGNYTYLILGTQRAVLFDAGTGLRDIVPVVRSLTHLPVTVIPSHLHFDHVGALGRLDRTAVLDDASLRARAKDSQLTLRRYEFLGFADRLKNKSFRVDEWWAPDSLIDLGGRTVRLVATPGHTPTSVALYDPGRHQLFCGDFIYPGYLYAYLPGASRSAYLATARHLIATIDPSTQIYAAHMADSAVAATAPVLGLSDLQALEDALLAIDQGRVEPTGFYPRVFPVKGPIKFATGWLWNNR